MTDLKKLTEDPTTRAAIAVGKDAAKRAALELLSGKEAAEEEAKEPETKSKRWKLVALALLGLFLVVGLIGLVMNYWVWFLAAGVIGLIGLIGVTRLRKRLAAGRAAPKEEVEAAKSVPAKALAPEPTRAAREAPDPERERVAREARRAEAEAEARAQAEARAVREQEVDEELAAMKARLKR